MHQIIIEITPTGDSSIKVAGHKGSKCTKLTADLEKALGKVSSVKKTNEFYMTEEQGLKQSQGSGT